MSTPDEQKQTAMPSDAVADWAIFLTKALIESGLSFVPGGSAIASAVEVLARIVQIPIQKRQQVWVAGLALELAELRKQVSDLTPEHLAQQEAFTTAFLQATQIALRTHQREKLKALRNAVLNVAAGKMRDDDLQHTLLGLIDVLNPCQMQLLAFFYDPRPFGIESLRDLDFPHRKGTPKDAVLRCVSCLNGQSYLYEHYINILASRDLLEPTRGYTADQAALMRLNAPRTTAIAQALMEFIKSPIPITASSDNDVSVLPSEPSA